MKVVDRLSPFGVTTRGEDNITNVNIVNINRNKRIKNGKFSSMADTPSMSSGGGSLLRVVCLHKVRSIGSVSASVGDNGAGAVERRG